jgi:predicted nucleic acid-binding protein
MPRYFLDFSALVKRYHHESGTAQVEALLSAPDSRFLISRLALVELRSCFARLVREGLLAAVDFPRLVGRLEADVGTGLFAVAAVSGPRPREAAGLLGAYGLGSPLRTLDAIHLATAQALHRRARLAAIVAADRRLLSGAVALGLPAQDVS